MTLTFDQKKAIAEELNSLSEEYNLYDTKIRELPAEDPLHLALEIAMHELDAKVEGICDVLDILGYRSEDHFNEIGGHDHLIIEDN